jgi:5-methyltetrahydropteroyltriglutamate--homocysteine methyltransferase
MARIKTTLVGSYPVPAWYLANPNGGTLLDATRAVVNIQETAGIDVVCDGELSRFDPDHPEANGMIEYFTRRLDGIRVATHDFKFTLTGPHMLSKVVIDRHYNDREALADAFATILAEQVSRLDAEVVQIDEANLPGHPEDIARAIERADKALGPGRVTYIHPDCGFSKLHRFTADAKIRVLAKGRDLYEGGAR